MSFPYFIGFFNKNGGKGEFWFTEGRKLCTLNFAIPTVLRFHAVFVEVWPNLCSTPPPPNHPREKLAHYRFSGRYRISQTGAPTPEFVAKTYYLARLLLKSAWKWKKSDREGSDVSLVTLRSFNADGNVIRCCINYCEFSSITWLP